VGGPTRRTKERKGSENLVTIGKEIGGWGLRKDKLSVEEQGERTRREGGRGESEFRSLSKNERGKGADFNP